LNLHPRDGFGDDFIGCDDVGFFALEKKFERFHGLKCG
jgi:hypothetical protein